MMEYGKLPDYSLAKAAEELVREKVLEVVQRLLPIAMAATQPDGTIQSPEVDKQLFIILGYGMVAKWLRSIRDTAPKLTHEELDSLMHRLHDSLEHGDYDSLLDEMFGKQGE